MLRMKSWMTYLLCVIPACLWPIAFFLNEGYVFSILENFGLLNHPIIFIVIAVMSLNLVAVLSTQFKKDIKTIAGVYILSIAFSLVTISLGYAIIFHLFFFRHGKIGG